MRIKLLITIFIISLSNFTGCATTSTSSSATGNLEGPDGIACVGAVMEPPPGLDGIEDPALLKEALGASGKGKLCAGKVFRVTHPLTVYRVWDNSNSNSVYGRWWSFSPPQGPRDAYREANGICPSWSALDRLSACMLKVGARIVVGPGQSADCGGSTYAKSAVNQVYLPNDSKNGYYYVDNCISSDKWPNLPR